MCCFSQPVQNVFNTNIFARLLGDGWQYLVYQMRYETKKLNAMILPLPVALPATEDKTVEFISLQKYGSFFDELANGFPLQRPRSNSLGALADSKSIEEKPALAVHNVGDFVASFVPTIGDFRRLDSQFQIPKESWEKIPRYSDYGFAVFQLKELRGQPHPMALKFRSRLATGNDRQAFFPTVHIHDGEVHKREEFDHMLYLQSKEFDAACGDYYEHARSVPDPTTRYVRSKWKVKDFCSLKSSQGILDGESLVHRIQMHGKLKNTDVVAKLNLAKATAKASMSVPLSLTSVTVAVGAVGFSWLINRRDKLARDE